MTEAAAVDPVVARRSALVVATVLALVAAWQRYRGGVTAAAVCGVAAVTLAVCGLLIPPAATAFHRAWMGLAGVLGYVNSRILLGIVYYGMITPIGLIMRATGHDPLQRRQHRRRSYWVQRERTRQSREGFERAF